MIANTSGNDAFKNDKLGQMSGHEGTGIEFILGQSTLETDKKILILQLSGTTWFSEREGDSLECSFDERNGFHGVGDETGPVGAIVVA